MRRQRKQGLATLLAVSFLSWTTVPPALAQSVPERTVVGTVHVYKGVEIARSGGTWVAIQSATALAEEAGIRTGEGGAAYLDLGAEGGIGLYPESQVRLGKRTNAGLAVRLERGQVAFRIPPRSRLRIETPTAIIQTSAVMKIAELSGEAAEGSIQIDAKGATRIQMQAGSVMVKGEGDTSFTTVRAGETAAIFAGEGVRIVPAQAVGAEQAPAEVKGRQRIFGWLPHGAPLTLLMTTVVGGTLGGLAASGAFEGAHEGSPKSTEQ